MECFKNPEFSVARPAGFSKSPAQDSSGKSDIIAESDIWAVKTKDRNNDTNSRSTRHCPVMLLFLFLLAALLQDLLAGLGLKGCRFRDAKGIHSEFRSIVRV